MFPPPGFMYMKVNLPHFAKSDISGDQRLTRLAMLTAK